MQHNKKVTCRLCLTLVLLIRFTAAQSNAANEDRVQELYAQAKAAQSRNDVPAAIAKYEEILRIAPKLGPAYNNLGSLLFRQGEFRQAAEILEQGLKVDPSMSSAAALLGLSLFESGDYAHARPRLEAALRANPGDQNVHLFLAKDLTQLGDFDAAAIELQQLSKRQPNNQEVWYLLARVYMTLSEKALGKINAIDPNSVLTHQLSGEMMEAMNNYDGAVVELKKAVDMAPRQRGSHYKLGDAYWGLSQWDAATSEYQAELAIDPGNCRAQWKLGSILVQKGGDAQEALNAIDKSLALCPNLTDARPDRARALLTLGRNADAIPDLAAAIKSDPSDARNHFLLAKAYRALGRSQEAQAEMQTFSKLEESARAATAERAQEVIRNKETAH
jgi:tetratricopeptide (TPR) repeat protein